MKRNQQFSGVLQTIVIFVAIGTLIAGIIGISNIILGTVVFEDQDFFISMVNKFPNQISIALDI